MRIIRFVSVFCAFVSASNASASANEIWNCVFDPHIGVSGFTTTSTIQIHGDELSWRPYGGTLPNGQPLGNAFSYRVLEDNDLGIVAVNSKAFKTPNFGTVIGIEVILVDKATGVLRVGHLGTSGANFSGDNVWEGKCKLK
jgi:hypothetical protein